MSDASAPESAVRRYLAWLDDPSSAVDQAAIDRAQAAFDAAADPIDRLHAAAAREKARAADTDAIRRGFVESAKAYADAEGLPVEAFVALGVDEDVLVSAGFELASRRGRRGPAAGRRTTRAAAAGPRAPQIPVATLKTAVGRLPKRFTLAQVAEAAGGGSPATVRKAVDELIAEGRAVKIGPAADHQGPGRAPVVYEQR